MHIHESLTLQNQINNSFLILSDNNQSHVIEEKLDSK